MNLTSNSETSVLTPSSCVDRSIDECVDASFQCFQAAITDVGMILSATNRLGVGPSSDPVYIGK